MRTPTKLSFVLPAYCCAPMLEPLVEQLMAQFLPVESAIEIILVDDGSPDEDWPVIQSLSAQHDCVKGIQLSRNFGQHHAILAGLAESSGEAVVVMDADLQDTPAAALALYQKYLEGHDAVVAQRENKQFGWFKRLSSWLLSRCLSWLSGFVISDAQGNFGCYSRKMVDAILLHRESDLYFPMAVQSVGYQVTHLSVAHSERTEGRSAYTFTKMLRLAMNSILGNSNKPLYIIVGVGAVLAGLAFLYAIDIVFRYFYLHQAVVGWSSIIVSIFFMGGLIISMVGIVALYIARIHRQVKDRPRYIVRLRTD